MNMITVTKRDEKRKAKQLRRSGLVPCCVYGGALSESISIQMEQNIATKLFRSKREGSKIHLKLDDQIIPAQIKKKTQSFENNEIQHISFEALSSDHKVNSVAHVILKNPEKIAGILDNILFEVPYASFPKDMIDTVTVDLETLPVGSVLLVKDIPEFQNENIDLQIDADSVILRIKDKKRLAEDDAE